MLRRIFAWLLILFFVFLFMNIMIFKFYLAESVMIYVMMIVVFFFLRILDRGGAHYGPEGNEGESIDGDGEDENEEPGGSNDAVGERDESGRV